MYPSKTGMTMEDRIEYRKNVSKMAVTIGTAVRIRFSYYIKLFWLMNCL